MRPLLRPILTETKISSISRAMSLSRGQVLPGARWDYSVIEPLRGDGTHTSTAFKARIVPKRHGFDVPQWSAPCIKHIGIRMLILSLRAVIKYAPSGKEVARENLKREWETYSHPSIASSACFRKLYDLIGDPTAFENDTSASPCLALEWLDSTFADALPELNRRTYILITAIVETIMTSCISFGEVGLVNTDTKPANILLSGMGTDDPVVKIADLGLTFTDGSRCKVQPYAMRAPEVFRGLPFIDRSQVWACAAMLLCWLKPGILGAADMDADFLKNTWCIAKLRRLFPDWNDPPVEDNVHSREFTLSKRIAEEPGLIRISSLEDEMRGMHLLPVLKDLLSLMLVVNPDKRPSAAQVLASQQFQSLKESLVV
ncbi:hypothetical protein SLS56_012127 [Neofusicoccum ribis]|uniref:Protein kinase domain-containing protein n=1 Tax=Neofusicoccum ribis TaxID=45134 RepID=A0ABR3S9P2_9PEZI